ncbi:MAG: hypothetical protein GYA24_00025 [Candidatus Lokiarchaeota archaeon]|nr:hypothetical protein [Candidatus Lokiarchaeota archaeon]
MSRSIKIYLQDIIDAIRRRVDLQTFASLSRYFRDDVRAAAEVVYHDQG